MNTTISANMLLPIPVVGVDPGPQYASDVNSCLTILDGHNHSPGYGVAVPSDGLNINGDLTFNQNNATNLRSVRFSPQPSPLSVASDIGCLYEAGVDLYYNDGSGNQIQITSGGALAGTPGSISGLVAPASASYVSLSSTFVWQSAAVTPANMDAASYIFRNLVANSKGLTLSPPAAMAADYTVTLPSLPTGSTKFLTMDVAGVIAAVRDVDNSTINISSNNIQVANGGITATQLATDAVTTPKIQDGAVTAAKLATGVSTVLQRVNFNTPGAHSWTAPSNVSAVIVSGRGGSGGGGGGGHATTNPTGGGGGGGAASFTTSIAVTPGGVYSITVGAKGVGGVGVNVNGGGGDGTNGTDSTFDTLLTFKGAKGGLGGTNAGAVGAGGRGILQDGGNGGSTSAIPVAGHDSPYASGGAQSGFTDGSGGGGGGGDGAGGAGGVGTPSTAGTNGVNGGGGGGGGGQTGAPFSGAGGDGTDGSVTISYVSGSP